MDEYQDDATGEVAPELVRYQRIIFLQGDEADDIITHLSNIEDGYIVRGATEESIDAAIAHLSQWDMGDEGEISDSPSHGTDDRTAEVGDYLLSWHVGLGHVGLERKVSE